jgi:hypothetical protein
MVWILLAFLTLAAGCGSSGGQREPAKQASPPPKITLFYTAPNSVVAGEAAQLCYSVESSTKLTLDPPVERVWPALTRCIEIKPAKPTTYTLTAENAEGVKVTATTEIAIHAARAAGVKIIDISANPEPIQAGQGFQFCVHGQRAKSWKVSAGDWVKPPDSGGGCVIDHPNKTTTYTVTATGASGETDSMQVIATVK